jgi:ubiquinone/menaquinone biosynthesis C-methylase UbiE
MDGRAWNRVESFLMTDRSSTERARGLYDQYAPRYDRDTGIYERVMLGDGRSWACSQAQGDVLEVAVGTGRNLPFYPLGIRLVGVDLSPAMLAIARDRACRLGVDVELREADAQALPFEDAGFDTVVCTLGLSSIPDDRAAVAQMYRVLRPGGQVRLMGHVASDKPVVRAAQHLLERYSLPLVGDHQTRRQLPLVLEAGFVVRQRRSFRGGAIERLAAVKPFG